MGGTQQNSRLKTYTLKDRAYYVYLGGSPGNACFFDRDCFDYYLIRLYSCIKAYRLQLHTYVLLPGEVHLLVSAFSSAGLARLLHCVSSSYSSYFFIRFERSCPAFMAKPVCRKLAGGDLVLDCQKYIELAPVRGGLVDMAGEYPWSGYAINGFGGHGTKLAAHYQYRDLCSRSHNPFQAYRDFIAIPYSEAQERFLEQRLRYGFPLAERRVT